MQDSKTEMALKTRQKFIKKSKQPHKDFDPIVICIKNKGPVFSMRKNKDI